MKNLKLFAVVIAIAFASLSFTTFDNTNVSEQLHNQIVKLLGDTTDIVLADTAEVEVVFTLNTKSEIVILSVDSQNQRIDGFVKYKLNYKKVTVTALNQGQVYRLPLKIDMK
jgi:hypothetical protein